MKPSVSIILPAYNAEKHIEETLKSIAAQSMEKFELIIINDGSTDSTLEICKQFQHHFHHTKIITFSSNQGIVHGLNSGIKVATGNYIARIDADDIMHPDRLLHQSLHLSTHPEISVVSCRVNAFPEDTITDGFQRYIHWVNRSSTHSEITADLFRESPLPHPSVMIRRDALLDVNGYRSFSGPEDYDLWLRLSKTGHQFSRLPEILLNWRILNSSLSRQSQRYSHKAFQKLSWDFAIGYLHKLLEKQNKSFWICGTGKSGRQLFRFLQLNAIPVSGFIDVARTRIQRTVFGLPVLWTDAFRNLKTSDYLLFNVGNWGAVEQFEEMMTSLKREPMKDYLVLSS